jgi:hypothetical protein
MIPRQAVARACSVAVDVAYSLPSCSWIRPARIWRCSVPFAPDRDVACLASALETGEPLTGPSTWILKARPGCVVPWHSHTAEERLIVVRGAVMAEMTDHPRTRLGPGGFAVTGTYMAHQFSCQGTAACVMFVTFDRAYDIRWGKAVNRD